MAPFAGYLMPIQYEGIIPEHLAVRRAVGVFDVSHMGRVEIDGPDAIRLAQRLLSCDVERVPQGGAQYAVLCDERGGVLDDVMAYRPPPAGIVAGELLVVTNAANHERDLRWLSEHAAGLDVAVRDRRDELAMLAVQGPRARALVESLADAPAPPRGRCAQASVAGAGALVCGTGYTGEPGVELVLGAGAAGGVWDALVAAGARPAGLGARDTLRLEAGLPLYGNELDQSRNPIEAGLGFCCAEQTGFIGADAVAAARARGTEQRLVCFEIAGRGIARRGDRVSGGGVVTSGGYSPCLRRGIGMAYVPASLAAPGTELEIDVRGAARRAVVREKPLYRKKEP